MTGGMLRGLVSEPPLVELSWYWWVMAPRLAALKSEVAILGYPGEVCWGADVLFKCSLSFDDHFPPSFQ